MRACWKLSLLVENSEWNLKKDSTLFVLYLPLKLDWNYAFLQLIKTNCCCEFSNDVEVTIWGATYLSNNFNYFASHVHGQSLWKIIVLLKHIEVIKLCQIKASNTKWTFTTEIRKALESDPVIYSISVSDRLKEHQGSQLSKLLFHTEFRL